MQSRCVLIKETLQIWPEPLEQDYSYMFFLCFRSSSKSAAMGIVK